MGVQDGIRRGRQSGREKICRKRLGNRPRRLKPNYSFLYLRQLSNGFCGVCKQCQGNRQRRRRKPRSLYPLLEKRKKYRLTVVADGVAYEAYDTLLPVTPIKKIDYEKRILGNGELLYQVYYYVDKQQGTNYYKSIQYKNQTLYRFYNRLTVYVDVALNEKNNKLPASILHSKKDTARIDLLSLSEPAYKFYSDLNNILLNDGGMFTSVAANPISNISNGALGFFQASDNSHKEIIIDPK